jgi:hypothetical protein
MQLNDPRAAGFDSAAFRDGIALAMQMGMPEIESERVTFIFKPKYTYENQDPEGNPYDWTTPAATEIGEYREVQIPVAMEFVARTSQGRDTSMGFLLPSHVEIYIMDTHINEVRDADELLIDGDLYRISAWPPPIGLFDFTLYPLLCEAVDES